MITKKVNKKYAKWMVDFLKKNIISKEDDFLIDTTNTNKGFLYINNKMLIDLSEYNHYEKKMVKKRLKVVLRNKLSQLKSAVDRTLKRINGDEINWTSKEKKIAKADPYSKEFESWDKNDLVKFAEYNLLFWNICLFKSFNKEKMVKWIRKSYSGDEVNVEIYIDLRNYKRIDLESICQKFEKRDFSKSSMYEMACTIANWNPSVYYEIICFFTLDELKKICSYNEILDYKHLTYLEIYSLLYKQENLNFDCVTKDGFFEIPWFDNDKQACKNLLIKWWEEEKNYKLKHPSLYV